MGGRPARFRRGGTSKTGADRGGVSGYLLVYPKREDVVFDAGCEEKMKDCELYLAPSAATPFPCGLASAFDLCEPLSTTPN